ncbi:MAG: hypothetical protein LRZ91_06110 [Desulfotomaculum sp.]|jgi:FAD/FMN-containing dehydrogenase|nr:hypothetical protein [Desulfotomaculum sp.]MCL0052419.1 hypothetical protein [Peptococcaceae bacterium]MCL0101382.1 hypothetical protein [Peptococcaceae bacterium]
MVELMDTKSLEIAQDYLPNKLGVVEKLIRFCLTLGGTISGEHDIGTAPFIPLELSADEINLMRSIKRLLDPKNILNSGKIFG